MTKFFENPVTATIFVAVASALGYLGLNAAFGGLDGADYVTAPAVGLGGALGYRIGARRSEERRRRKESGRS